MDPKYPGNPNNGAGFTGGTMGAGTGTMGSRYATEAGRTEEGQGGGFDINMISERAEEISQRISQLVKDRPITCVCVALGAGYLIGRLLRA